MRFVVAVFCVLVFTVGCGTASSPEAVPAPSPSVSPDRWATELCSYLATQDPANGYALGMAANLARESTLPELVDLAGRAERAGSQNLLRGWCQEHVPSSGVTPGAPQ